MTAANPFTLPGGTGSCPPLADYVGEWSRQFCVKYTPLMVEMSMHSEEVSNLACYLAWGSKTESRLLIDSILDELHQARHDEPSFMGLLRLIVQVLNMNDSFQPGRLQMFLHGENVPQRVGGIVQNEAQLPGFMDLLVAQSTNALKRCGLLRWMVHLHDVEEGPNFMQPLPEVLAPTLLVRAFFAYATFQPRSNTDVSRFRSARRTWRPKRWSASGRCRCIRLIPLGRR